MGTSVDGGLSGASKPSEGGLRLARVAGVARQLVGGSSNGLQ